jgi:general secretion pathway protein G
MHAAIHKRKAESGFTLIELLVVIIILGVLAAVVVFAVGGINNNSKSSACSTEKKTLQTAQEGYYAVNNGYASTEADLVPKFLADTPQLYSTAGGTPANGLNTTYTVTAVASNPDNCT